jgi:hypothetical protein
MLFQLIATLLCVLQVFTIFDIEQFGAIPHSDELKAQFINQKAIMSAIKAASQSSL